MKLAPMMHFVYIKRVSGEYQCGEEPRVHYQKQSRTHVRAGFEGQHSFSLSASTQGETVLVKKAGYKLNQDLGSNAILMIRG
jgi:hypothetical protein